MDEPWIIFLDELKDAGEGIPEQELSRADDMAEAVHEAYQAAADRLHLQLDWEEGEALRITKGFVRVSRQWISDSTEQGTMDWDELEERLELFQQEWDSEVGTSTV